jgi:hypothetical protein
LEKDILNPTHSILLALASRLLLAPFLVYYFPLVRHFDEVEDLVEERIDLQSGLISA